MPKTIRKHYLRHNRRSMNLNCLAMLWWYCFISGKYLSLINRPSRSFTLSSSSSTITRCFRSFSIQILIPMSIVSDRIKYHQWFNIWIWRHLRFVFLQRRWSHMILRRILRISSYRSDQLAYKWILRLDLICSVNLLTLSPVFVVAPLDFLLWFWKPFSREFRHSLSSLIAASTNITAHFRH